MNIMKIGNVELYEKEVEAMYWEHKYIVTYGKIYRIDFSPEKGFFGTVIARRKAGELGFVGKGRFMPLPADEVNRLVGRKVV